MSKKLPSQDNKGRGRPKTEVTPEIKKTVKEIIHRFRQEVQPRGILSVNSMVKYSKELYETEQVAILLKEHFWKNGHGRKVLDDKNKVIQKVPSDDKLSDKNKVIDTEDAIDKLYSGKPSDKRKLIASLKRNEENLIRMQKENQKLKERLEKKDLELQKIKEDKNNLTDSLKELESLFFSWLDASANKDTPIINAITTGKSRTSVVDEFFLRAFDNPIDGYKKFEELSKGNKETANNNIIPIEDKKKNKSIADDFGF